MKETSSTQTGDYIIETRALKIGGCDVFKWQ